MKDLVCYTLHLDSGECLEALLPVSIPVRLVIDLLIRTSHLPTTHNEIEQPLSYALFAGPERHRLSNEQTLAQTPYANGGELWLMAMEIPVVTHDTTPASRPRPTLQTLLMATLLLGGIGLVVTLVLLVLFLPDTWTDLANANGTPERTPATRGGLLHNAPSPAVSMIGDHALSPTSTMIPRPISVYAITPASPVLLTRPLSLTLRGSALDQVETVRLVPEANDAPPMSASFTIQTPQTLNLTIQNPPVSLSGIVTYTVELNNRRATSFTLQGATPATGSLSPTSTPSFPSTDEPGTFLASVAQSFQGTEESENYQSCISGQVRDSKGEGIRSAILIITNGNLSIEKITLEGGTYRHCNMGAATWRVRLTFVPGPVPLANDPVAECFVNGEASQEAIVNFIEQ